MASEGRRRARASTRGELAMRRLSIGVNWQGAFDLDQVIEQAKVADEAGVEMLSIAEAWGRDALTLLAVLARETSRIKLGTSIINIFSRTPAAVAQHFATLDELSGGRMVIGLGSSGPNVIEHFHGVKFEKPLQRTREYIEIINMLLAEEPLNYHGKIFKLERGFTLRFKPVRAHIPIHVASITPKSLEQTARLADGWIPIFLPRPQWKPQLDSFYSLVEAAGRQRAEVDVRNPSAVVVSENREAVKAAEAGNAAFYIARMGDFYYEHFSRMGYADEANAVRRAWADGGSAAGAAALPRELVEDLSTVGTVDECIEAVDEATEAGFTLHGVSVQERDPKKRYDIYRHLVG
ncbi:MAG: LLM class flavin-dependent oxidoreductase [Dehalococcoidia bacterium]|nr:LLM class flavin-dependent oxidoreductase [Dehalococcoidia bacterium]